MKALKRFRAFVKGSWLTKSFTAFIAKKDYPCVGAKAALHQGGITVFIAKHMDSSECDEAILKALSNFIHGWKAAPEKLSSFVVIFDDDKKYSELEFENTLWARLQALHYLDSKTHEWNRKVSSDVTSPRFSMSLRGEAFFVIGLHADSSRKARRFRKPTLTFNLHAQFERLRAENKFDSIRDQTRKRDIIFSGSPNPMLNDFGTESEALQYSGRKTEKTHKCPFTAFMRKLTA